MADLVILKCKVTLQVDVPWWKFSNVILKKTLGNLIELRCKTDSLLLLSWYSLLCIEHYDMYNISGVEAVSLSECACIV